jgi:transcriptional regulator with XRE-family HTH domain
MNLNDDASEISTPVQLAERYAPAMAVPDDDDRGEALAWYFRLLVRQEVEKGMTRAELCSRLGIEKGHLSQIESGKLGIGVPKLVQFADAFGLTPGELLNRALSWWEPLGRRERARVLAERAQKAAEKAARAASGSGEHPSQSPVKVAK